MREQGRLITPTKLQSTTPYHSLSGLKCKNKMANDRKFMTSDDTSAYSVRISAVKRKDSRKLKLVIASGSIVSAGEDETGGRDNW